MIDHRQHWPANRKRQYYVISLTWYKRHLKSDICIKWSMHSRSECNILPHCGWGKCKTVAAWTWSPKRTLLLRSDLSSVRKCHVRFCVYIRLKRFSYKGWLCIYIVSQRAIQVSHQTCNESYGEIFDLAASLFLFFKHYSLGETEASVAMIRMYGTTDLEHVKQWGNSLCCCLCAMRTYIHSGRKMQEMDGR